jgi:hypothetical protein
MASTAQKHQFALCLKADGCEDIQPRKVYRLLPDAKAAAENYLRIVDESGEDYLYPASYFVRIDLPREAQNALTAAT